MTALLDSDITESDHWHAGEDRVFAFTVYVDGTTQAEVDAMTATPQTITGWGIIWELRKSRSSAVVLELAAVVVDGPNGQAEVTIAQADTQSLAPGNYRHTLSRYNAGQHLVLADGKARLLHPISGEF